MTMSLMGIHKRDIKIPLAMEGELWVAFVTSNRPWNDKLFAKYLKKGDVLFSPEGLIRFLLKSMLVGSNVGWKTRAVAFCRPDRAVGMRAAVRITNSEATNQLMFRPKPSKWTAR